jgi:hypothetical protein
MVVHLAIKEHFSQVHPAEGKGPHEASPFSPHVPSAGALSSC